MIPILVRLAVVSALCCAALAGEPGNDAELPAVLLVNGDWNALQVSPGFLIMMDLTVREVARK
jgi:hypothetical protein